MYFTITKAIFLNENLYFVGIKDLYFNTFYTTPNQFLFSKVQGIILSSDVSSASYALDDSGINIKFDLKDYTPNTNVKILGLSPFTNITDSFTISNYSNYEMVSLNVTALTKYNCEITNQVIIGDPLVQYKSEFFCFKAGAHK